MDPRVADIAHPEIRRRPGRRLFDKILVAFHQACDQGDIEVAGPLIRALEVMDRRRYPNVERRRQESA